MEKIKKLSTSSFESGINLNKVLAIELIKADELWIHIDDVRELPLSEKLTLFREGLDELARLLQYEPKLKQVKKISGISWIIRKNPELVKSLGFDISESLDGLEDQVAEYERRKHTQIEYYNSGPPGYAYMDKEKFISLYGKQPIININEGVI
jgi:hypothetical protein